MKTYTFFLTAILGMILIPVFGQDTLATIPIPESLPANPADWFTDHTMEVVYGAVVVIGGYLSAFIPGLNKISVTVYRVLAWAIITGAAAVLFKGANIWGIAIAYFVSSGLYQVVLRLIFASPKPKDKNGNPVSKTIQPLIR